MPSDDQERNVEAGEPAETVDTAHPIDDATLDHLQRLARITVPADERERLKHDLGEVLGFVAQLREVDVEGLSELTRPISTAGVTRQDEPSPSLPRERALAMAPATRDGFFEVPRTVDEG